MKTEVGHYYIFFNIDDFWNKVNYWKSKGCTWLIESHMDYKPTLIQEDMPIVLNVDNNSMMFGRIDNHRQRYFSNPTFVKLYNKELRKLKLKRILK
jgi:hypothetical protein